MAVLSKSEKQDFEALLSGHGYRVNDFELNETADRPQTLDPAPFHGNLAVTRTSNQATKTYRIGSGVLWLDHFEHDLKAGVFGTPD